MLTNFQTIYYLLSLLFILLGIFVHPFFYCFILFELVKRVELMQFILKAMYVPLKNIVTILILCIIMEYVFSVIALTIYQSHFPIISDTKNILNTFMRMFDQTFKQDGGVGTYLKITLEPGYNRFNARYYAGSRFFYDLIFFLLINMIAFQIFFMIIIDYFSQSKEKTEEFTELSESKCLVCEIEREDLEKIYSNSKDAFEMHINHSHGLIDYISYLVYLQTLNYKDPIIEERIWNLHLSNNLNYLPKKNCFKKKENEMLKEHLKK
jgi:inositol 1,4,5-triphosphate receptor type 2